MPIPYLADIMIIRIVEFVYRMFSSVAAAQVINADCGLTGTSIIENKDVAAFRLFVVNQRENVYIAEFCENRIVKNFLDLIRTDDFGTLLLKTREH